MKEQKMQRYTITRQQLKDVVYKAEIGYGDDFAEIVRTDYQGRGYGNQPLCVGLVIDHLSEVYRFLRTLEREGMFDEVTVDNIADSVQIDSMGRSQIYYFEALACDDPYGEDMDEAV